MTSGPLRCDRNAGWSLASAHFSQPLSQLLASAQCCATESGTAPLVMLCTGGAEGTRSCCRMSGGGTFVTPYGCHSAAHAAGTSSIGVVVRTDEHGPAGTEWACTDGCSVAFGAT